MSLPSNALTITETSLEKRRRHADFMKSSQDPHLKFTSGHLSLQDVQSCPLLSGSVEESLQSGVVDLGQDSLNPVSVLPQPSLIGVRRTEASVSSEDNLVYANMDSP
jgi:hypothetical protein